MKWIGQNIYDQISRFRDDLYLEAVPTSTETDMLVVSSTGLVSKRAIDAITVDVSDFMTNGVDNRIVTATGADAMNAEADLTFTSETLTIGADDNGIAKIERLAHTDDSGGRLLIQSGNGGGTNKAGGELSLIGGKGTGNAVGGSITFQSTAAGSSGDTVRSLVEVAAIDNVGNLQVDGTITTGTTAAMTSAGLLSVANQSNITGLGTITSGVWNGTTIATANTAAKVTSIVAGDGIDVSGATGDVTVTAEDASATNPGVVELATTAETTTGTDTTRAVTPDGLKDGYQGSTNVVTVGTIGTGTWNATAIASAKMATGTSSAQGALELATTAEADSGTDTARAITAAGLKSHVDARFSYQYIALSMNSSTPADGDWMIASGNGIGNHLYNQNVGAGGTTPHNTDGSASQITISQNILSGGIIVPYDCTLVGFYAHSRASSNDQKALGLFTATATWNDKADITGFLRAYSEQDISAGPDTSYSVRPVEHSVLSINKALSAGDQMWPATRSVGGGAGGCITSMTIVLKTLIP